MRIDPSRGARTGACVLAWAAAALGTFAGGGLAQEVEEYFDQLSSMPPLVGARAATTAFNVYGPKFEGPEFINPNYRESIRELADRFSPIMKLNNGSLPQEVIAAMTRGDLGAPLLRIDAWYAAGHDPERARSWALDLRDREAMYSVWDLAESSRAKERGPGYVSPDRDTSLVMYLDFPGSNPEEWQRIHIDSEGIQSHAYVHFFLLDERPFRQMSSSRTVGLRGCDVSEGFRPTAEPRYAPVLQYWFFYPFNDGVNNHEGDWEHLNVVLSTQSALDQTDGLMTAEEVCRLLTGHPESTGDEPRIRSVDYYFHHSVLNLDYRLAYLTQEERADALLQVSDTRRQWVGQDWVYDQLAARIARLGNRGLQKPVVYVGGNSVGLDVLINPPGHRNRNPHGSYPFPGVWKHVGPLGSSERMYSNQPALNGLLERMEGSGECPDKAPRDPFICFDRTNLTLLPDWEVYTTPESMWQNFWMVLPVRWGYPVTESPGGGLVSGLNVGQEAPVGPSRSTGWNKTGASRGFGPYEAHALPKTFQTGAQEAFGPALGALNWSDLALTLPPLNPIRLLVLSLWGTFDEEWRQFSPREALPPRHESPLFVIRGETRPEINWINALPIPPSGPAGVNTVSFGTDAVRPAGSWAVGVAQHIGRLGSEVSLIQSEHTLRAQIQPAGSPTFTDLAGRLRFRELHGDVRWSINHGPVQPFLSLGYGWAWTRLALRGHDAVKASPGFWPNTRSIGIGLELFLLRQTDAEVAWSNLDVSLRADMGRTWQDLPILWGSSEDVSDRAHDARFSRGMTRDLIRLGLTFSF